MDIVEKAAFDARQSLHCLTVYRNIAREKSIRQFKGLLEGILAHDGDLLRNYNEFFGYLLEMDGMSGRRGKAIFREHLLDLVMEDENIFSLRAERESFEAIDELTLRAVRNDLDQLQAIYDFDFTLVADYLQSQLAAPCVLPVTSEAGSSRWGERGSSYPPFYTNLKEKLKDTLAAPGAWSDRIHDFYSFYKGVGSGAYGRFWAFKWNSQLPRPTLLGVMDPDPVTMAELVNCEEAKKIILQNTRQFVQGSTANNIMLYGDRGTGKSSLVKSLVHEFGPHGLRIIEVSKHDLQYIPEIVRIVKERSQKFIVFIDDLSFEGDEKEYKHLKAILEGSIEKPPANVLVYATSNIRNLVREYFSDREADEVGKQDTYQEKMSLADRFGITIVFSTPDQETYLQMVESIAQREGLEVDPLQLKEYALKWVMWHNSRSGRTARQFINDLKGKLETLSE